VLPIRARMQQSPEDLAVWDSGWPAACPIQGILGSDGQYLLRWRSGGLICSTPQYRLFSHARNHLVSLPLKPSSGKQHQLTADGFGSRLRFYSRDFLDNNRYVDRIPILTRLIFNNARPYQKCSINLLHYLWNKTFGYLLHPKIPTENALRVADVGTGTG
jgi:hypothetical protein